MRFIWILPLAALFFGFTSCHSGQKKTAPNSSATGPAAGLNRSATETANLGTVIPSTPEIAMGDLKARPVTSSGDNTHPRFSPSGNHILFISRDRASHRHAQVYELDIARRREKRLTFHDGDDESAEYFPDGRSILFSSPTDEAKEDPALIEGLRATYLNQPPKPNQGFAPTEIYRQSTDGREQERLTWSPGYDSDVSVDGKGLFLLFTSTRAGTPRLFVLNLKLRRTTPLENTDGKEIGARFSPDGKQIVWSRFSKDNAVAQLMLAPFNNGHVGRPTELTKGTSLDLYPTWHPQGKEIVFASNRDGATTELYSIDIDTKCVKRLTTNLGDKTQPDVSADGTKLAFTLSQSGKHQIYVMDYQPPAVCVP